MSTGTPPQPNPAFRPKNPSLNGRIGSHISWANTPDRRARMAKPRSASPSDVAWHARQLGFDPETMTDAQRKQAESARRAYFARLNKKSVLSRQAKAAGRKAAREQARKAAQQIGADE